jgi:hypothetical protein
MSTGVAERIYATCVAITEESGNTLLLVSQDLIDSTWAIPAKDAISAATGVPVENIILGTTHNHTAPALDLDDSSSEMYSKSYKTWMMEAATAAMADRKPAKTFITTKYVENQTFIRHFLLEDGSRSGWSKDGAKAVSPLYEVDNGLQLIKFTREGAKDIILMNWQGHPMSNAGGPNELRSDIDVYRRVIEPALDCHFAYFLGASGDVSYDISCKPIRKQEWYTNDYVKRGTELAQHAISAAADFREVKTAALQLLHNKTKVAYGNGNDSFDMTISVLAFGDIAFVVAPYEMFNCNGTAVKNASPFEMTFLSSLTNGNASYIAADHAYEYDCYELTRAGYARGAAEKLVDEYIAMLKQLHDASGT